MAWHQQAWPRTSRTKSAEETWFDFLEFWEIVRFRLDCDLAEEAMKIAATESPPAVAMEMADPRMRLLVGLCRNLQILVGNQPFSLSCYQVEEHLGVPSQQAYRWLHGFGRSGILECVSRGKPGPGGVKGSASRWKYLGDLSRINTAGEATGGPTP